MVNDADRKLLVDEFRRCRYPSGGLVLSEAWLGIYQMLMWFDEKVPYLHVNEVSALRTGAWQWRAKVTEAYIADSLGASREDLPDLVDRMMKLARWEGKQRHNPLGNGFRTLVHYLLTEFGNPQLTYLEEQNAAQWFPGITLPGRSERPAMDILVAQGQKPRAVLSCKWSIRHDRISDVTNECIAYRQAAMWQNLKDFDYYVATNEFSEARLAKVLSQECVSGLVHAHLPLVARIGIPGHEFQNQPGAMDLTEFVKLTFDW